LAFDAVFSKWKNFCYGENARFAGGKIEKREFRVVEVRFVVVVRMTAFCAVELEKGERLFAIPTGHL
jgi:hypothetical protein